MHEGRIRSVSLTSRRSETSPAPSRLGCHLPQRHPELADRSQVMSHSGPEDRRTSALPEGLGADGARSSRMKIQRARGLSAM